MRPEGRPRDTSRLERVSVARGSIAYSAVSHPWPLPIRNGGTRRSTLAEQSTRVSPHSTSADPLRELHRVQFDRHRPQGRGRPIAAAYEAARSFCSSHGASTSSGCVSAWFTSIHSRGAGSPRIRSASLAKREPASVAKSLTLGSRGALPPPQPARRSRCSTARLVDSAESTRVTPGPADPRQHAPQQRVVRAAEEQGVDLRFEQRREVAGDDPFRDLVVLPALLDQGHEQRAGLLTHPQLRGSAAGSRARRHPNGPSTRWRSRRRAGRRPPPRPTLPAPARPSAGSARPGPRAPSPTPCCRL